MDLAESDLTPLDAGFLAAAVSAHPAMRERMKTVEGLTRSELEHRQGIWWYLLATVLLLLGAETLLSNRLSRVAH